MLSTMFALILSLLALDTPSRIRDFDVDCTQIGDNLYSCRGR